MAPEHLLLLVPAAPAVAGLIGLLLPPASPAGSSRYAYQRLAAGLGIAGAAVALLVALVLLATVDGPAETSTEWVRLGDLTVTFGLILDLTGLQVAVAVAAVALAVQVYSIAYLGGGGHGADSGADERYGPYAAQVSIFTAAMLLVVFAGDLIVLLVGWEVMGACSYLLIGHDRRLPEAPAAAVKAFLVTRIGDVGFLLGIAVLGVNAGSFRISTVLATAYSPGVLTAACLLLLAGVAGKSAQFPLHTWLPDAMAGPTPISALIHAATMVASGIYVVVRLYPLFLDSPTALGVLGLIAAVTLLLGALAATAQDDIKRVLAWSTVSQIGYMAAALAIGAPAAAIFHLLTHAAFKALLFLAAGCVIHAVGTNLMSRMGGLRSGMPAIYVSTVIGLGALAGLPPLAGFWSKESVLAAAEHAIGGDGPVAAWIAVIVWLAALAGVAITAWYATRLLLRVFFGPAPDRLPSRLHVPSLMAWPVLLLAVPSAVLGLLILFPGPREDLRLDAPHVGLSLFLSVLLVAAGAGWAFSLWRRTPAADPADALGRVRPAFANAFWLDGVQHLLVVRPARALAGLARRTDETVVDGVVEGTGRGTLSLGWLLAAAHRAALPRAVTAVLTGVLLLGLAAAVLGGRS